MSTLRSFFTTLYHDEQGLTTVEYAIAGGLIGAVVVTAFTSIGTTVLAKLNALLSALGGTPS